MNAAPRVTIAGGGLAGMTAALRLAERGYAVKLYEQKPFLGGNLASRPEERGPDLDIYPHMFLSWYHNFWQMLKDAGVDPEKEFDPISSVKQLRRGAYPHFSALTDGYSPRYMIQNLFSGVGPPADMFVFWYSTVDLLAEHLNPTMMLDDVSVTGFMQARPYMTERAAKACDNFITMVWAIPSYQTSAEDYREYLSYSVASYKPPCLLAKGPASRVVIAPLEKKMADAGVDIHKSVGIKSVACADGRVKEITLEGADGERTEPVDGDLLLSVPPQTLSTLVRRGGAGDAVVDVEPKLAELARLRSQRIPIVHAFFKRKLHPIPQEPVGLYDSRLALAFTDISESWTGIDEVAHRTVLSVSASNPFALPDTGVPEEDGYAILKELAEYIDFDPGHSWGQSPDIDWERTRFESNADSQLFINETGVDVWRPPPTCEIPNLYFAGNFCANRIGMMTVESAVASGLEAVRAVVERRKVGAPVKITEPKAGSDLLSVWLRYAYAWPAMYAKAWSTSTDMARGLLRKLG
jgi:hypothetical protein